MLSFAVILSLLAPTPEPEVAVSALSGAKTEGRLTVLSADGVEVKTSKGVTKLSVRELAKVRFGAAAKAGSLESSVELADGSVLAAREVTLSGSAVVVTLADGGKAECARRLVKSIRFGSKDAAPDVQWKSAVIATAQGDQLIVRKSTKASDGPAEVFLDPLEGSVLEISPDAVKFDFDGDKLDVKREKLEGVIFFKPTAPKPAEVFCRVTRGGTAMVAATAALDGDRLQVTTLGGVKTSLPLDGVTLDFAAGNETYLAALEPDDVETKFSLQPKGMKTDFAKILGPRASGPFGSRGVRVGKQTFADNGLTLHSNTKLVYRVPDGFGKFSAVVGLAEEASRGADLHLRVLADQRVLVERSFSGEDRGPFKIENDLAGAERLTIIVEPATGLEFGDILVLGDARFVK